MNEDTKQFKEDFNRMRTHLNVAAKLELQTQEKMYESRLHHLENVLEEMRQREGHFMRLAEETAVLKDQVDALRELSVMSLKSDRFDGSGNVHPTEDDEKAAAITAANAAHYAAIMDSCSGSSLPQMLLAQSPTVMSEDNTLAKEMMSAKMQTSASYNNFEPTQDYEVTEVTASEPAVALPPDENANDLPESNNNGPESDEGIEDDSLAPTVNTEYDNAKLMLLDLDENAEKGIRVSGTLKLRSRDPLVDYRHRDRLDMAEVGCFPTWMFSVWAHLFN